MKESKMKLFCPHSKECSDNKENGCVTMQQVEAAEVLGNHIPAISMLNVCQLNHGFSPNRDLARNEALDNELR